MIIDYTKTKLKQYLKAIEKVQRPFQRKVDIDTQAHPRMTIDSWMGTGKTLMALTACMRREPARVLIVCSKNALWTWQKEIAKWFPDFAADNYYHVISGTLPERLIAWRKESLFYVCTYSTLWRDIGYAKDKNFDVILADEFHTGGWRNRKSKGWLAAKELSKKSDSYWYPTSGSTANRGPTNIWAMLNIYAPKVFASYWRFIYQFCDVSDGMFGKEIGEPKNTEEFARVILPYWHRIDRKETDKYLPPLNKRTIPIEMTKLQSKLYRAIDRDMFAPLEDGSLVMTSTTIGQVLKLRQILACPLIVDPGLGDYGAAIEISCDMMEEAEDLHGVVFTPFRPAVPHFKTYIRNRFKTKNVFHVWGGMEPKELKDTVLAWKRTRGTMVGSLLYSQSFELETSSHCYFCGYDWDQDNNDQASARLRRLISPGPITANYMRHKGTQDDFILECLLDKRKNVRNMFKDFERLKANQLQELLWHIRNGK